MNVVDDGCLVLGEAQHCAGDSAACLGFSEASLGS